MDAVSARFIELQRKSRREPLTGPEYAELLGLRREFLEESPPPPLVPALGHDEATRLVAAELNRWVAEYYRHQGRLDQPDIDSELVAHLRSGLLFALRLDGFHYDPMLGGPGSETLYYVRTADGWAGRVTAWGSTDGHGLMVEQPRPAFVPMVADVLRVMRAHGCNQDDAVIMLGGQP